MIAYRNEFDQSERSTKPDIGKYFADEYSWFSETYDSDDEQELDSISESRKAVAILDRTSYSLKSRRKRTRNISSVYALVLHQTGFTRGNITSKYDRVSSHFVILPNGVTIQLHPLTAYLWTSNRLNSRSVAVEFVGNFPNTRGRCWNKKRFGCHEVSEAQIQSGRDLIRLLIKKIGMTHVYAHRQSSGSRGNDPGPDIWFYVGQWAIDSLGLSDGGANFTIGTGKPIPAEWRRRSTNGTNSGQLA